MWRPLRRSAGIDRHRHRRRLGQAGVPASEFARARRRRAVLGSALGTVRLIPCLLLAAIYQGRRLHTHPVLMAIAVVLGVCAGLTGIYVRLVWNSSPTIRHGL